MNFTDTQFKTADTQYILLLRMKTQFHKTVSLYTTLPLVGYPNQVR